MVAAARDSAPPEFHFSIKGCKHNSSEFHTVSGRPGETGSSDDSPGFHSIDVPGVGKVCKVVVRNAVFVADPEIWDWYDEIEKKNITRRTVVINLFDERDEPEIMWALENAWPIKITGRDPQPDSGERAIKSIEIAYETLVITRP